MRNSVQGSRFKVQGSAFRDLSSRLSVSTRNTNGHARGNRRGYDAEEHERLLERLRRQKATPVKKAEIGAKKDPPQAGQELAEGEVVRGLPP